VTIVSIEGLLLAPYSVAIGPTHGIESCRVHGVPEMDADCLIRAVACGWALARDRTMFVCSVRVKAAVPAGFKTNVVIIHCLEIEIIDGAWDPYITHVAIGDLPDCIVGADVKYMPLWYASA